VTPRWMIVRLKRRFALRPCCPDHHHARARRRRQHRSKVFAVTLPATQAPTVRQLRPTVYRRGLGRARDRLGHPFGRANGLGATSTCSVDHPQCFQIPGLTDTDLTDLPRPPDPAARAWAAEPVRTPSLRDFAILRGRSPASFVRIVTWLRVTDPFRSASATRRRRGGHTPPPPGPQAEPL